jgi:hypothetical protein
VHHGDADTDEHSSQPDTEGHDQQHAERDAVQRHCYKQDGNGIRARDKPAADSESQQ